MPLKQVAGFHNPEEPEVDSRLKVLWIEDKGKDDQAQTVEIDECFAVFRGRRPSDISESLRKERPRIREARRHATFYEYPSFPFDCYICDFNLSSGPNIERTEDEPEEQLQLKRSAQQAEAAGLTAGVLTCLSFDDHPAVILPHTGYPSQIGNQRALIRLFCDDFLDMGAQDEELTLQKAEFQEMLVRISRTYRLAMPRWSADGLMSLSYSQKLRILALARQRIVNGRVLWLLDDRIRVDTAWQSRWLLLRSLWFEAKKEKEKVGFPIEEVEAWLESFGTPRKEYLAAKGLAERYFQLSTTRESGLRHKLSAHLQRWDRLKDVLKQREEAAIEPICKRLDLPFPEILDSQWGPLSTLPHVETQKHLAAAELTLDSETDSAVQRQEQAAIRRLALLMLVVKEEHRRRVLIQEGIDAYLEPIRLWLSENAARQGLDHYQSFPLALLKDWDNIPAEALERLAVLDEFGITEIYWNPEEAEIQLPVLPTLKPQDLHKRIDPLPERLRSRWESVNKEIGRDGLNLHNLLTGKPGSGVSVGELRELQSYASELGFPRSLWPSWLRG